MFEFNEQDFLSAKLLGTTKENDEQSLVSLQRRAHNVSKADESSNSTELHDSEQASEITS